MGKPRYGVRQATPSDLGDLLTIYADARAFMLENGNPEQWGTVYPPQALVESDVALGQSYLVTEQGAPVGAFVFFLGEEPDYRVIEEGAWKSDAPYGVIHRVAARKGYHGIFRAVLDFAEANCRNLRIDTHEDNRVMQHQLGKYGFSRCGIIHIENGDPRIAYQKII